MIIPVNSRDVLLRLSPRSTTNALTVEEKLVTISLYNGILESQKLLNAKALKYSITTENVNYNAAVSELQVYLNSLAVPVLWNNTTGITLLTDRVTFNLKFDNVSAANILLSKAIIDKEKAFNYDTPPTPTSLVATGLFASIKLTWVVPAFTDLAHTEILRNSIDNLDTARVIGSSVSNIYVDNLGSDSSGYYWVKLVSNVGKKGLVNSSSGTYSTSGTDPQVVINVLTGKITETQLYKDLGDRINLIDTPTTGLVDTVSGLVITYGSTASANTSAQTASTKATEAGDSASAAAASATTATTQAGYATSNAAKAATSETNAAGSASSASTSATTAAGSASTAGTKADAAVSSAATATTKATDAGNSATAANTSAVNASTYSSNALSYSNTALSYSNSAASSAADAAGIYTNSANILNQVQAISTGFDAALSWNFDSSTEGWAGTGTVVSWELGNIKLVSSTNDPILVSPSIVVIGSKNFLVRARVKRLSANTSNWEGGVYYSTSGHSFDANFKTLIPDTTVLNEWRVLEWDMSKLTLGGNDWVANTITNFRIDLNNNNTDQFLIDWITVGRVAPIPYSSLISQEVTARTKETGELYAQYSVKVDTNGYVSGFGLSSTANNSTSAVSNFAVRADTFYIANPSGPGILPKMPFIVKTTASTINGIAVPAGVYIQDAFISNITANKIDTRGLSIKDNDGNIILAAGIALDYTNIGGDTKPANNATVGADWSTNVIGADEVNSSISTALVKSDIRTNLVYNGSFENGFNGWTGAIGSLGSSIDNSWGSFAISYSISGTNSIESKKFYVDGGSRYTISGDSLLLNATGGALYFDIRWYNGSNDNVGDSAQVSMYNLHNFAYNDTNRAASAITLTAPSSAVYGTARFVWQSISGANAVVGCRQIKVERGELPITSYTSDATIPVLQQNANDAKSSADTANGILAIISSDSWLSKGEKPSVINENNIINAEFTGITAQATDLSVSTTNYSTAITSCNSYLSGLTPSFSDLTSDTPINGATLAQKFKDVYVAKQVVLNAISASAAKRADWVNIAGQTDAPASNATVGATFGTNISGQITSGTASTYIADAAIGNAQIGGNIQSTNYSSTAKTGWLLDRTGNLTANTAYLRGEINGGSFTGWGWPASGQTGYHIGPNGILIGNANDTKYLVLNADGNIDAPQFSITNGVATFSGKLSAASGTFGGTLTAENAVVTGNITANGISKIDISGDTGSANVWFAVSISSKVIITASVWAFANDTAQAPKLLLYNSSGRLISEVSQWGISANASYSSRKYYTYIIIISVELPPGSYYYAPSIPNYGYGEGGITNSTVLRIMK